MHAIAHRLEFAPPPPQGLGRSFALAVLAHLLLLGALAWGVNWKRDASLLTAEAELWAATPQQAAPKPQEAPPPPPPAVVQPAPPAPAKREADIALERERRKREDERRRQELEKEQARKKQAEDQKRLEERRKREQQQKAAQDKARDEAQARQAEALRQENLRRIQGLAGATGGAAATGSAQRSAGPSDSYAGRIRARVKPNIVFADDIPGNPVAEVEVRMAPDGTIIGRRITKESGVKAWDDAVLRALDRTGMLPRDVDGRVHTPLIMEFRPKG